MQKAGPLTFVGQDNVGLPNGISHLLNGSADALSDKNVLSDSALLSRCSGANEGVNAYAQLGTARTLTRCYDCCSESTSSGFNMDYKLAFQRTVEPSRNELSAELRYNRSRGDAFDAFSQQQLILEGDPADDTPDLQTNDLDTRNNEWTLQDEDKRGSGSRGVVFGVPTRQTRRGAVRDPLLVGLALAFCTPAQKK